MGNILIVEKLNMRHFSTERVKNVGNTKGEIQVHPILWQGYVLVSGIPSVNFS